MNESKIRQKDFSLDALKGMQSVRATFTLPKHAINLISTIANQLGVKQKSICQLPLLNQRFRRGL